MRAFRELGPNFTFEASMSPNHSLATQGPYAVVRHPSYTGHFLMILGQIALLSSHDLWITQVGLNTASGNAGRLYGRL